MEEADVDVDVDEDVVEEERARLRRVRRGKGAHVENPEPPILLLLEHLTRSDGVFEMREVSATKRGVKHGRQRNTVNGIGKKENVKWECEVENA